MKTPEPIEIEAAEVERLIEQAKQGRLDAAAQKRIVPLLRTLLWLERTLLETRISLAKLRKVLFGKRTEKPRKNPRQPPEGAADSNEDGEDKSDPASDTEVPAVDMAAAGVIGYRNRCTNPSGRASGCRHRRAKVDTATGSWSPRGGGLSGGRAGDLHP